MDATTETPDVVLDLRDRPALGASMGPASMGPAATGAAEPGQRHLGAVRWAGLGLLAVLNIADLVTTHIAMRDGAVEGNPVTRTLMAHGALSPAKLVVLAFLGVLIARSPARLHSAIAIWFVAGVYTMIVVSNVLVIGQLPH